MSYRRPLLILFGLAVLGAAAYLFGALQSDDPAANSTTTDTYISQNSAEPSAELAMPPTDNPTTRKILASLDEAHLVPDGPTPEIAILLDDGRTGLVRSRTDADSVYATVDWRSGEVTSYVPMAAYVFTTPGGDLVFVQINTIALFRKGWTAIRAVPGADLLMEETFDALPELGTNPVFSYLPGDRLNIAVYHSDYVGSPEAWARRDMPVAEPIRRIEVQLPAAEAGLGVISAHGEEIGPDAP